MEKQLDAIERQVGKRNFEAPPLHLWHPPLSGDIDIVIRADGSWWHEGSPIARDAIVRLFASILRREDDGDYYLVTPVEKWRLQVESHPLLVVDVNPAGGKPWPVLRATLNTGREVEIGNDHPLFLDSKQENVAAVRLQHGLTALFSRAAWYRLVNMAASGEGAPRIRSGNYQFCLAPADQ